MRNGMQLISKKQCEIKRQMSIYETMYFTEIYIC